MSNKMLNNINALDMIETMEKFYANNNYAQAMIDVVNEICLKCEIDKLYFIVYDEDTNKYLKMYEYDKKTGAKDYAVENNIAVNQCLNVLHNNTNDEKEQFKKICGKDNYFYTKNYSEIDDIMSNIGFECENKKDIKEFYVSLIDIPPELFTYCTFERYSEEMLSELQFKYMNLLCKIIYDKIKGVVKAKSFNMEIFIRDIILTSENMAMAVVDKESRSVLYRNGLFKASVNNIEVGSKCEELDELLDKCDKNCINGSVYVASFEKDDQHWLIKSIPFKLTNEKDAYMIYSKNSTDYIEQINAIDELTQASLLKGFEEYYRSFVQRSSNNYALCSLDIDKFKYINNIFGYEVGNEVLKKIASQINEFIDIEENFCRLGEDKFAILLHYKDDIHLHLKLRELTNKFEKMRDEHFSDTRITVIGGVTLVDKTMPLNMILDQATTARKSAKGSLKNKFSYYNEEIDINLQKEIQIEERIPHALANDEFVAFLQPKFNTKTKEICGAEALVRWITPTGMIFPDQFIPLFEKNDFILTLDFIIYNKVMKYIRECLDENLPVYPISVNVSRNHIKDNNFIEKFMELIEKYKIPHEYLELEVTESVFVEDREELKKFINKIKEQKLKISIDDFGTAYSSLQTLTDIDVDILKIDKGFLDNISCEESNVVSRDEILIKNIINLAKELDFKVICEGVETDKQVELLKNIGCELGQGYVFAKPMSIADYQKQFIDIN